MGIFLGRVLWANDSVSPPMNTIASRDQFKQKGIGENLVVNSDRLQKTMSDGRIVNYEIAAQNKRKLFAMLITHLY